MCSQALGSVLLFSQLRHQEASRAVGKQGRSTHGAEHDTEGSSQHPTGTSPQGTGSGTDPAPSPQPCSRPSLLEVQRDLPSACSSSRQAPSTQAPVQEGCWMPARRRVRRASSQVPPQEEPGQPVPKKPSPRFPMAGSVAGSPRRAAGLKLSLVLCKVSRSTSAPRAASPLQEGYSPCEAQTDTSP